jgi:hypothetical protein
VKSITVSISLLWIFTSADAQVTDERRQVDSVLVQVNNAIDSIQRSVNSIVNPEVDVSNWARIIQQRIRQSADTLGFGNDLDSIDVIFKHKTDSLARLVHEIKEFPEDVQAKLHAQINVVPEQTVGPMAAIPNLKSGASLIDTENPLSAEFSPFDELGGKIIEAGNLPQQKISQIQSMDQVQLVQGKANQVNDIVDKAQVYQQEVSQIAQGELGEVKAIPEAIEGKLAGLDEVSEMQKYTGEMNQYQEMFSKGNDPNALKELAKQQAVKHAMDHFAANQEALKTAMDRVSKLKSKHAQVADIRSIAKWSEDKIKGRPVLARIIPGIAFQVQKAATVLVDLSPSVAYRLTGRLNVGGGWNERLSFTEWNQLVQQDRIWGPRLFTDFSLNKGFALKGEVERMNVHIPAFLGTTDGSRGWVWSVFVGFKKDYSFYKKVRGNVQLLYNLYDDHDNSPYLDRFNVRMGFELRSDD